MRPAARASRPAIAFRSVNRRDAPGHDPLMQRHHLLPRQMLASAGLRQMIEAIGERRVGLDDFRVNGMLLPASEEAALAIGLPLHRGPHRRYNQMVLERAGQIEREWSARRAASPVSAALDAGMRLVLLQTALRRRLLARIGRRLLLNRRDPSGHGVDFSELDAMAEALWGASDPFTEALIAGPGEGSPRPALKLTQPATAFAALSTARTLAVATSGWIPTPHTTEPSARVHST
jgi:A nuclease family of the HNH/ENDO VII superfamily with conserved AHH